jgi:hypothetical protein
MELLKSKKAAKAKGGEAQAATAEAEVDLTADKIKALNHSELDTVVKHNKLDIDGWSSMTLAMKRATLIKALEDDAKADTKAKGGKPSKAKAEPTAASKAADADAKAAVVGVGKKATTQSKPAIGASFGGTDVISATVAQVASLTEAEAYEQAAAITDDREYGTFKLGGILARMQENAWFHGCENLRSYIEQVLDLNYRRAMYYVQIYKGLIESGVQWTDVNDVGWTKLKEIVPILSPKNVGKWAALAKKSTVLKLHELVVAEVAKRKGLDVEDQKTGVSTKTFKLHSDQREVVDAAISKAKTLSNTEFDAAALEYICLDFTGNAVGAPVGAPADLKAAMAVAGWEAVAKVWEALWPDMNLTVEVKGKASKAA